MPVPELNVLSDTPPFPKGACETLRILGNQPSQSQTGKGR